MGVRVGTRSAKFLFEVRSNEDRNGLSGTSPGKGQGLPTTRSVVALKGECNGREGENEMERIQLCCGIGWLVSVSTGGKIRQE